MLPRKNPEFEKRVSCKVERKSEIINLPCFSLNDFPSSLLTTPQISCSTPIFCQFCTSACIPEAPPPLVSKNTSVFSPQCLCSHCFACPELPPYHSSWYFPPNKKKFNSSLNPSLPHSARLQSLLISFELGVSLVLK